MPVPSTLCTAFGSLGWCRMYHLFPLRSLILPPSFSIPSSSDCYPLFLSPSPHVRLTYLFLLWLTLVLALQIAWYERRRARRSERRDEIVRTRNKEIREVRVQAEIKSSINIVTDRRVDLLPVQSLFFVINATPWQTKTCKPALLKLHGQWCCSQGVSQSYYPLFMSSSLFLAFPLSLPLPLPLPLSLSPSSLLTFLSRCSWRMNTRTPPQPSRGSGPLQHLCPLGALKQGVYILFLLFSFLVFSFLFSSLLFCSLLFPPLLFLISTLSIIT